MILTDSFNKSSRQAILDYLQNNSFSESAQVFSKESGVAVPKDDGDNTDGVKSSKLAVSGLLEKKWTSVIRLQKKVFHSLFKFSHYCAAANQCSFLLSIRSWILNPK